MTAKEATKDRDRVIYYRSNNYFLGLNGTSGVCYQAWMMT